MKPTPYILDIDDRRLELEATVALVANAGDLIPGLARPRLPIVPDDGLLDLLVLRVGSLAGGIRGALELLSQTELGGNPSGAAFRARGRRIRIEAQPEQPRQVDGDDLGQGALEASVRPAALDILVPPARPMTSGYESIRRVGLV
jgi:diacylglycerol kinase family enzyme